MRNRTGSKKLRGSGVLSRGPEQPFNPGRQTEHRVERNEFAGALVWRDQERCRKIADKAETAAMTDFADLMMIISRLCGMTVSFVILVSMDRVLELHLNLRR
jgi:hypothetical protein